MKEKQIKFSNILFYCVLMTLIVSGQILLGVYVFSHIVIVQISSNHLASYFQLLMVVFLVLIVFVFALVLVNLVVYCKNKKNEKKSESMAFVDSLFEEKEKNKENFQKEGKKVLKNRNIMLFSLNIFMFFVVSMFVGMFAGNIIHIGIFIPVVLILAVVQILFSWQFLPKSVLTDMVEECIPLSPEEMPTIFEIAIRAMKSVGVEYSFAICVCNEQRVSIMRGGKNQTTILFVCKDFFKLFSDVELMALFMHLFARLKREKNSLEKKIENIALSTTKLSFLTTGVSISKIKNLHKKIAERSKYEDITFADEVIKNAGMQKDFVSAHAKIMMFGFYGEELPERSEFENEE
ncbi:MAG: hypothetical protein FWC11_06540, partial [Firmicutes bacterium]|nr:hypothetical protein [Bacillota bacterium]